MSERRIGAYICYCGGNISDYVDVEKVREAVKDEPGVIIAKTTMFACSDAAQQEMIDDIKQEHLDGLVVASCSPKLHLFTFKGTASRADLNPYQYVQVNLREQVSWAHTDDRVGATDKAIRLVRAGIAKAGLTEPLEPIRIDTVPQALVIGAGIAGMRAAIGLADLGIHVFLVERSPELGGWIGKLGEIYPYGKKGSELIAKLVAEVTKRDNIAVFTEAQMVEKSGCVGNFEVKVEVKGRDRISLNVGTIIVATGFDGYTPKQGEFGFGMKGVLTLPEFRELLDNANGMLTYNGKEVRRISYIYCVGSMQRPDVEPPHFYCSRYCCSAAVHTSLLAGDKAGRLRQYHLFRDMRTYGKFESLYTQARESGAIFVKFNPDEPPNVERKDGELMVRVKDLLTNGEEIELANDLVVLVTGMVPRKNERLVDALKLPQSIDGFFNEIHPKLRPVETVIDGVLIAGTCQGPKTSAESVASALAAAAKAAPIMMKGYVELAPLIAAVDPERCEWCGLCNQACPYNALDRVPYNGKEIASVNEALCKGCGACVPICPQDALDVKGYTDAQMRAMIQALAKEVIQ
jgi:heterodisulfide reductase subunit A